MKHKKNFAFVLLFLSCLLFCGCASLIVRIATGGKGVSLPQIVSHLEPVIKDNKIFVSGRITIENAAEADFRFEKTYLAFEDEDGAKLAESDFEWGKPVGGMLEAPVDIALDASVLNKESINVNLKTAFIYKKFNIRVPVQSKLAVLHLGEIKKSIQRPLNVKLYTKLYSDTLKNTYLDYTLDVANPIGLDLLLRDAVIRIYAKERKDIANSVLPSALFKAESVNHLKGTIKLSNLFGVIFHNLLKTEPIHFELKGRLEVSGTAVYMPFGVESTQEIDFSLFRRK